MTNIHLCNDEKFIDVAKDKFDQYYPDTNYFFIHKAQGNLRYVKSKNGIWSFNFRQIEIEDFIFELINDGSKVNVFIHYLDYNKARLALEIRARISCKMYWIFYGSDLYKKLYDKGKYNLYDNNESLIGGYFQVLMRRSHNFISRYSHNLVFRKFIRDLDYFCFWNKFDYELLLKNYNTKAKFKFFRYGIIGDQLFDEKYISNEKKYFLLNHSGSKSGNHLTILRKIDSFGSNLLDNRLLVPLSYGDKENIRRIDDYCNENLKEFYMPIIDFMSIDKYYELLSKVKVAFFGHRRQEAGGNINFLLASGCKVFLREQNNLFSFYKEMGVKVYSLENNFIRNEIRSPLTDFDKNKNRDIILDFFSKQKLANSYSELIEK